MDFPHDFPMEISISSTGLAVRIRAAAESGELLGGDPERFSSRDGPGRALQAICMYAHKYIYIHMYILVIYD